MEKVQQLKGVRNAESNVAVFHIDSDTGGSMFSWGDLGGVTTPPQKGQGIVNLSVAIIIEGMRHGKVSMSNMTDGRDQEF